MPGKLEPGFATGNAGHIKETLAYCEGRNYRAEGTSTNRPQTANPHAEGGLVLSEAAIAWDAGWKQVDDVADGVTFVGESYSCAACGVVLGI